MLLDQPLTGTAYVDGPRLARAVQLRRSGRLRSYVRPLLCGRLTAGPDGLRDRVPNRAVMSEHQPVPRVVPILGSTDYHLAVAVLARSSGVRCRWRAGSSLLWTPVYLAADHHGPDDAGHFVGQRDRCELFWLARQQSQEPRRGATPFGPLDDRGGAEHEQPA